LPLHQNRQIFDGNAVELIDVATTLLPLSETCECYSSCVRFAETMRGSSASYRLMR